MRYYIIILIIGYASLAVGQADSSAVIQYLEGRIQTLESENRVLEKLNTELSNGEVALNKSVKNLESKLVDLENRLAKLDKSKVKAERDQLVKDLEEVRTKLEHLNASSTKQSDQLVDEKESVKRKDLIIHDQEILIDSMKNQLQEFAEAKASVRNLTAKIADQEKRIEKFSIVEGKLLDDIDMKINTFTSTGNFNINSPDYKKIGNDIAEWKATSNHPKVNLLAIKYEDWRGKAQSLRSAQSALANDFDKGRVSEAVSALVPLQGASYASVSTEASNLIPKLQQYAQVYCRVRQGLDDFEYLGLKENRLKDVATMEKWSAGYPYLLSVLQEKRLNIMSDNHPLKELTECK